MTAPDYLAIVNHYEACLKKHGVTPQGLDWPNLEDVHKRFEVMLGVLPDIRHKRLLDLGCGFGLLADYLKTRKIPLSYEGIDLSAAMVAEAKKRHPDYSFRQQDILTKPLEAEYDIILMNGVLTVKAALKHEQMEDFAKKLIHAAFKKCRVALAFNVMSTHVDWQREDLFHWPFDAAADFLTSLSKHFVFRQDYGLYEYTAYLYKDAR